jgi:hypothetical protein
LHRPSLQNAAPRKYAQRRTLARRGGFRRAEGFAQLKSLASAGC